MKIYGGVLAIAAVTLVLSGCSAPEAKAPVEAAELPTASASPAPKVMSLKAESDEPTARADFMGDMTPDEYFLASMSGMWVGDEPRPQDSELFTLGHQACKDLKAGTPWLDIVVLDGSSDDAKTNNRNVITAGTGAYCYEDL